MALPSAGQLEDATNTESTMKQRLEAMLAGIKTLVGGGAKASVTIASGTITPTLGRHVLIVDTQGAASSDDLDNITTSGYEDGAIVMLQCANAARAVVVKHGTGNISLDGAADITLDATTKRLWLRRDGSTWYQTMRTGFTTASGTTVDIITGSGNYTVPAETVWVTIIGGGGGGAGGGGGCSSGGTGASPGTDGSAGGDTSFGAHVTVTGGSGGSGGIGGDAYFTSGVQQRPYAGFGGRGGAVSGNHGQHALGLFGYGGLRTTSPVGAYGAGGAGGQGGPGGISGGDYGEGGGGGGSGGMSAAPAIRQEITGLTIGATVSCTIGAGGAAGTGGAAGSGSGTAGTVGQNGGAGNAGVIIVEY